MTTSVVDASGNGVNLSSVNMSGFKTLVMGSGASGTDTTPDASIVTLKAADYATFKAGTITADKYDTIKLAAATEETEVNVSGVSALVDVSGLTNLKTLTTDKDSYVAVTAAQFGGEKIGATTLGTLKLTDALTGESGAISGAWTAGIELVDGKENAVSITAATSGDYAITGDGSGDTVSFEKVEGTAVTVKGLDLSGISSLSFDGSGIREGIVFTGDISISGETEVSGSQMGTPAVGDLSSTILIENVSSAETDQTADFSGVTSDLTLAYKNSSTTYSQTIKGGSGNDFIGFGDGVNANNATPATLIGGSGADVLQGGKVMFAGSETEKDSTSGVYAESKDSFDDDDVNASAQAAWFDGNSPSLYSEAARAVMTGHNVLAPIGFYTEGAGSGDLIMSDHADVIWLWSQHASGSASKDGGKTYNVHHFTVDEDLIFIQNGKTGESTVDTETVTFAEGSLTWDADNATLTIDMSKIEGLGTAEDTDNVTIKFLGIEGTVDSGDLAGTFFNGVAAEGE